MVLYSGSSERFSQNILLPLFLNCVKFDFGTQPLVLEIIVLEILRSEIFVLKITDGRCLRHRTIIFDIDRLLYQIIYSEQNCIKNCSA